MLAVRMEAPDWRSTVLVDHGGATPTIGAMIRARWVAIYVGKASAAAFAFESVVDELCFRGGPGHLGGPE